jgi:hypothetical protein
MELVQKIDDLGKPAWIALMVLGFIFFWPIGLAILAYLIWSGRMACGQNRGPGRWYNSENSGPSWRSQWEARRAQRQSSGNRAFDDYREDMLRRLEDEQKEFKDFLERLRHAKDKQEFDQFMDDRKRRGDQPSAGGPVTQSQG